MWANVGWKPLYCHMNHTHPNSIFSGVWHISCPNVGTRFCQTTTFSDPRPACRVIEPNVIKDFAHNSGTVAPIVNNGSLFMFPSWLPHGVQQHYNSYNGVPRITISFNAMMVGDIQPAPHQLDLHKTMGCNIKKWQIIQETTMGWTKVDEPNCTGLTKVRNVRLD